MCALSLLAPQAVCFCVAYTTTTVVVMVITIESAAIVSTVIVPVGAAAIASIAVVSTASTVLLVLFAVVQSFQIVTARRPVSLAEQRPGWRGWAGALHARTGVTGGGPRVRARVPRCKDPLCMGPLCAWRAA